MTIRDQKELHGALERMACRHEFLPAPRVSGIRQKWLPCSHCFNIEAKPENVVSFFCWDCMSECDCGLKEHEHDVIDGMRYCAPLPDGADLEYPDAPGDGRLIDTSAAAGPLY
jgi:hypothetical protein